MQYRLRTLVLVMVGAALFFAGYRLGLTQRRQWTLEELIELIQRTDKPKSWGPADDPFAPRPTINQSGDPFAPE
jgi:hypothetical protein